MDSLKKELKTAKQQMKEDAFILFLMDMDTKASTGQDDCKQALISETLGFCYYTKDADKSIYYMSAAVKHYSKANDALHVNFNLQNIAFTYEEQKKDIIQARIYALQALAGWEQMQDTMQQANINKYIGYLEGKTRNYSAGKKYVQKAIKQFTAKENTNGVAVCYFDMATIYFEEKKYDSAIVFFKKAKDHWVAVNTVERQPAINNFLLRIYIAQKDNANAATVFSDNAAIIDNGKIYWKDKLSFYTYSSQYLQQAGKNETAVAYTTKYNIMKDSLVKAGVVVN